MAMSLIQQLKALADKNRLKILQMLLNGDLCVGALAQHLGISKPAVSQHLRILREAGLVKGEKRGYWTHYVVEREAMRGIAEQIQAMSADGQSNQTFCWRISDSPPENQQLKP